MSPRSVRRAAERKAKKLARKEALQRIAEPVTDNQVTPEPNPHRDERPGKATGPKTPEGKAISSMNALKTGLTGRTVLRPSDDPAALKQHVEAYFDEYKPQGLRERELVQSLAETRWRLNRSFALEAAIFSQAATETEEGTPAPSNLDNLLKYEKTLKNLHLQEARLHRRFDKDLAEFRALQAQRGFEFSGDEAALLSEPKTQAKDFEFSTPHIDHLLQHLEIPSGASASPHQRSVAASATLDGPQPLINAA
jgi:hypothetical protein